MNYNEWIKVIASLLAALVLGGWMLLWLSPDVNASTKPSTHYLDNQGDHYCSENSIKASQTWLQKTQKREREVIANMFSTPQMKLQATTNTLLANLNLESLVVGCSIRQRLGKGI